MQTLPDELVLKIISYLEWDEVLGFALLCKHGHTLANDPSIWKQLYEKYFANLYSQQSQQIEINWRQSFFQAVANQQPDLNLLLAYLHLYEYKGTHQSRVEESKWMKPFSLRHQIEIKKQAYLRDKEIFKKIKNLIVETCNNKKSSWTEVVLKIRAEANNSQYFLTKVLHGLASLIVSTQKANLRWRKEVLMLKRELEIQRNEINKECSLGTFPINKKHSEKIQELTFKLAQLGDEHAIVKLDQRLFKKRELFSPNYYQVLYKNDFEDKLNLSFEDYIKREMRAHRPQLSELQQSDLRLFYSFA